MELLDDRFSKIRVVNRDPNTGNRGDHEGSLSVIFRARDIQSNLDVAIKFFDPDIQGFNERYRMDLFERECKLLERLVGTDRCLQLVQTLTEITISVTDKELQKISISCGYFVLEWLGDSIEDYFLRLQLHDAKVKLLLFRDIVLGTFALHRANIVHRDLKFDNLRRAKRIKSKKISLGCVVVIDLGASLDMDSEVMGLPSDYSGPVGASAFAPIEAHLGLASVRELAMYTDLYGLGCILHDLFNAELYISRLLQDQGFNECYGACRRHMLSVQTTATEPSELIKEWNKIIRLTRAQVNHPGIESETSTVPLALRDLLNMLLRSLTNIDYSRRETRIETILRRIDSGLRILDNRLAENRARQIRDERRLRRERQQHRQAQQLTEQVSSE